MSTRECSFRGVRLGEVFVPLSEQRTLHNYDLVEDREGRRVRFYRKPKPGRVTFVHKTYSNFGGTASSPIAPKDNRQYVKLTETVSSEVGGNSDAIFAASDRVIVIGHIDDAIASAAAA
jgi:hypothetical protein